jgi:hypothetical protein
MAQIQGKVEIFKHSGSLRTATNFYYLGLNLEAYRDFLRNFLDALPPDERITVENRLSPAILALVEMVDQQLEKAEADGIIDESLAYSLGTLGLSLIFVASFQSMIKTSLNSPVSNPALSLMGKTSWGGST